MMFNRTKKPKPMTYDDWLNIAKTTRENREGRCLSRDSDGNVCMVKYRDGVEEEAALLASKVADREAAIDVMIDAFTRNEVVHVDAVHTS